MSDPREVGKKIQDGTFTAADIPLLFQGACLILNQSEDAKEEVEDWDCEIQYDLGGTHDVWFKVEDGKFSSGKGKLDSPSVTMILSEEAAANMFMGKLDATAAYMDGSLKIEGNIADAQRFGSVMAIFREEAQGMQE